MRQLMYETIMVINEFLQQDNRSPAEKLQYERMKAEVEDILMEMTLDYRRALELITE